MTKYENTPNVIIATSKRYGSTLDFISPACFREECLENVYLKAEAGVRVPFEESRR